MYENDAILLSRAYYGYLAKKEIQREILTGNIVPTPAMKAQFDEEFATALQGYEQSKEYITNEVVPELKNKNFTWTADFTNGVLTVVWNGEGEGPELPSTKYKAIVTEV